MVRTKRARAPSDTVARPSPRKRTRGEPDDEVQDSPSKRRSGRGTSSAGAGSSINGQKSSEYDVPVSDDEGGGDEEFSTAPNTPVVNGTPSKRKRSIAVATPTKATDDVVATPSSRRKAVKGIDSTPIRNGITPKGETPRRNRNDRSAKKKSVRAMIRQVVDGGLSDDEVDQEIAEEIYKSSDEEGEETVAEEQPVTDVEATPTKRPRGRPRKYPIGVKRSQRKSPTPPRDLPPHEQYFAQNRPGAAKTSDNTLASLQLLTHEEYFDILHSYEDRHAEDIEFLQSIHVESFPQWAFELSQGFSICVFGYGSKRPLLQKLARHLYDGCTDHAKSKIVIVNGYVRTTTIREVLTTVTSAIDKDYKLPAGNPLAMMDGVKSVLESHDVCLTVIVHSVDAPPLRKPGFQSILAHLAAQPNIQLICSADTPDFPLLWDGSLRSSFNFLFHDCTTFAPYTAEMDVVDEVHELLGRKARRVGGKEGVSYVLRSLPENAKNLFRLLVTEVLVAADEDDEASGENAGVEYRMMYNKAVEEFICSSEMAFRTLLKEFHDHQMITSRKDVLGAELLSVPFRKEELEGILEELMS